MPGKKLMAAFVALCVFLLAAGSAEAAPKKTGWEPAKTYVFSVGILKWKHPDQWASFPNIVKNRSDQQLIDHFKKSGVPDEQIAYLKDEKATLKNIRTRFREFIQKPGDDDLLIVYFAGHGWWDSSSNKYFFVNYDAQKEDATDLWSVQSICKDVGDKFSGGRILFLIDCCHSGGLVMEMRKHEWECDSACLASTFGRNESTGRWTFTNALLQAFRGDPQLDFNGDGDVTLGELSKYVERKLAFFHGQRSVLQADDGFADMVLAKAKGKRNPKLSGLVEVLYPKDKKWYRAEVIRSTAEGPEVSYADYDDPEIITDTNRIRTYQPTTYAKGTRIKVKWNDGKVYPAIVKESWYGLHFVHYEGYDNAYDDWVSADQIRK
jgi:hypothetical protein